MPDLTFASPGDGLPPTFVFGSGAPPLPIRSVFSTTETLQAAFGVKNEGTSATSLSLPVVVRVQLFRCLEGCGPEALLEVTRPITPPLLPFDLPFPMLGAGATESWNYPISQPLQLADGTYLLRLTVDPDNLHLESDEEDNIAEFQFYVETPS